MPWIPYRRQAAHELGDGGGEKHSCSWSEVLVREVKGGGVGLEIELGALEGGELARRAPKECFAERSHPLPTLVITTQIDCCQHIMDGEHLGDSWMPILQCISQLGRLLFFASGVDSDDNFLNSGKMHSTRSIQSTVSTNLDL